MFRAVFYRLSL